MDYLKVIGGLVLLVVAGDLLVRGAVSLAERLGLSKLVIGLTVIALGTSAPELIVGIQAALSGSTGLALGNVVGSNTANILLVMGLPAIFYPFYANDSEVRHNLILMIMGMLLFFGLCVTGPLVTWHGVLLLSFCVSYVFYSVWRGRSQEKNKKSEKLVEHAFDDMVELPSQPSNLPTALLLVGIGIAGLVFGAKILVDGASAIASAFGVSQAVIGLTIVAIGTSLPELVTAIVSARKGHGDVAVGNVIGSNIFNVFGVMGATAIAADRGAATELLPTDLASTLPTVGIVIPESFLTLDLWIMVGAAVALLPFTLWKLKISRFVGLFFTLIYFGYLYYTASS